MYLKVHFRKKTVFILMIPFLEINMLEKIVTASNFNEIVLYTFWRFCQSLLKKRKNTIPTWHLSLCTISLYSDLNKYAQPHKSQKENRS